ncbi:MAG: CarD family transcriptional regulator [Xanthomonadales bacterium]|jgi:RNA polymerase-interacting CarD/CdnL/TRCF family regulator|nr:CarD family transcriptional regulator [Xanthomonadales bacterium]
MSLKPLRNRRIVIAIRKGDTIHHPQHGIGTVQSIRKRSFSGPQGSKFAKMFFPRDEMSVMVRETELEETVRKPIEKTEARKVLNHISGWEGSVSEQWKSRANTHQAKLDSGDPLSLAEVYKALSLRQEEDNLSAADRRHLSESEDRLAEELAVALGKTQRTTRRAMAKSAAA